VDSKLRVLLKAILFLITEIVLFGTVLFIIIVVVKSINFEDYNGLHLYIFSLIFYTLADGIAAKVRESIRTIEEW